MCGVLRYVGLTTCCPHRQQVGWRAVCTPPCVIVLSMQLVNAQALTVQFWRPLDSAMHSNQRYEPKHTYVYA